MTKLTLDMSTFKALASDTRLDILRALDGKKLNLKELGKVTSLNKATLHEHLTKLNEAGLVKKKERDGHKWVYYKLTWKGEGLLHPENTRIVVMFSTTFISLLIAVMLIVNFLQPIPIGIAETIDDTTYLYGLEDEGIPLISRSFGSNYLGEIDAKEKTVGNVTVELQQRAKVRNSIGASYDDEDIVWVKGGTSQIATQEKTVITSNGVDGYELSSESRDTTSPSITPYTDIPTYCTFDALDNHQYILNTIVLDINLSVIGGNNSNDVTEPSDEDDEVTNETKELDSDANTTNKSFLLFGEEGSYFEFYPAVPNMIATVQDTTLLYLAVACLTFFGILFTLSTWRLVLNKKPKL